MDEEDLAQAAAAEIAAWLRLQAPAATVGLAGGSTPRATYELLREQSLPWNTVTGWMTDERFVPGDHPDSNAGMVRDALFDHVPARLLEVPYIESHPDASAERYAAMLEELFPEGRPGLVLLGVGTDGHTASLFPDTPALDATGTYVANRVDALDTWRLTATNDFLAKAARTMFIVSGDAKADVVAQILEDDADLPAARLSRRSRDVVWLLDRKAASRLSG